MLCVHKMLVAGSVCVSHLAKVEVLWSFRFSSWFKQPKMYSRR